MLQTDPNQFGQILAALTLPLPSLLLGVGTGSIATYFVVKAVDQKRWNREKADRLETVRRDAIARALLWLEPMQDCVGKADTSIAAFLRSEMDEETFVNQYPSINEKLEELTIPADLRVLLPEGTEASRDNVARTLSYIRFRASSVWLPEVRREEKKIDGIFEECGRLLNEVSELINDLARKLRAEYVRTYQ